MNMGKMSESGLKQAVFGTLKKFDMGRKGAVGVDAGEYGTADSGVKMLNPAGASASELNTPDTDAINPINHKILVSSAETFGDDEGIGALAVIRASNSLAAAGARATAAVLNISVKGDNAANNGNAVNDNNVMNNDNALISGKAVKNDNAVTRAKRLVAEAAGVCKALGIEIIHGNTIVATENHVSVTMLGETFWETSGETTEEKSDKLIIMTGSAGLSGAKILSHKYRDVLTKRLTQKYIDKADADFESLSVAADAHKIYTAAGNSAANDMAAGNTAVGSIALHDVSSGGVFGALWELCERENVGCRINVRDISINQVTIEICEILDISPYELMGDGALLAIVPDTEENRRLGVVIGVTTSTKDRIIVNNTENRFLEPNRRDSFYEVKV